MYRSGQGPRALRSQGWRNPVIHARRCPGSRKPLSYVARSADAPEVCLTLWTLSTTYGAEPYDKTGIPGAKLPVQRHKSLIAITAREWSGPRKRQRLTRARPVRGKPERRHSGASLFGIR